MEVAATLKFASEMIDDQEVVIPSIDQWMAILSEHSPATFTSISIRGVETYVRSALNLAHNYDADLRLGACLPGKAAAGLMPILLCCVRGKWVRSHLENFICPNCQWKGWIAMVTEPSLYLGLPN